MNSAYDQERDIFENNVVNQHAAFHDEQVKLIKALKAYTDVKSADRFTATDARAMRAEILAEVCHVVSRCE